mmetsp:Transcript_2356/g.2683  ORF Transcript_2356/g.2683 Transcript_2356/m.2683 type:complete len:559 (+) Transcript_2356:218-1894(+)|eukprot:CAMPEP_0184022406 /NCGR_PEP_ID=MMETSP0954-20121128/10586_1 /TAXON_ID=627963 /ORGANISM="Aplanochytrium sp, Strain PBS07" /LENGTH=558 /DNA_ID=CAMNT_0026304773 /DNA_START=171 /DNA_END=1847 /DNA_ORIENTATION=-
MLGKISFALCLVQVLAAPDFFEEFGALGSLELEFGEHSEPLPRFNDWHVKVHVPSSCNVTSGLATENQGCPVFVFAAAIPVQNIRYDRNFAMMATHGVITVSAATNKVSVDFEAFAKEIAPVVDYVFASSEGLQENITGLGVPGQARLDKVFFGGHGQGARIMLHRATQNPCEGGRLGGMVMYSPSEDYAFEVNLGQGTIIPDHPRDNVPWIMPGLLLMAELDGDVSDANTPPCAPPDISNFRFFNKWRGPIWQTMAGNFGFLDMTHSTSPYLLEGLCANNANQGDPVLSGTLRQSNREVVTGLTLHFFNHLLYQDSGSRSMLTPTRPPDVKQELNGQEIYERRTGNLDDGEVVTAECVYDPDSLPWQTRLVLSIIGAFVGVMLIFGSGIWYFYLRKRGQDLTELEIEKLADQHGSIVPGFGAVKEGGVSFQNPVHSGPSALDRLERETVTDTATSGVPSRIPSNYGVRSGMPSAVSSGVPARPSTNHESTDMVPFSVTTNLSNGAPPTAGRESTDMVPFSVTTNFSTGEAPSNEDLESSFPDGSKKNEDKNEEEDIF